MTSALRRYRYADLAALPEDKRFEIIDGELIEMPAPVIRHQRIVLRLVRKLAEALADTGKGEVLVSPCDVKFDDENVVQPDVIYISRERSALVEEKYAVGADLVVEVLSESTRRKDLTKKKALFAKFGVPLFLVVDPDTDRIELYRLAGKTYDKAVLCEAPERFTIDELGVSLDLGTLFT